MLQPHLAHVHRSSRLAVVAMAAVCLVGCGTSTTAPNQPTQAWTVVLHVTGGFAGVDRAINLASTGALIAADSRNDRRVTTQATSGELEQVSGLVDNVTASSSSRSPTCRDCLLYSLTLTRGGTTIVAELDDTTVNGAPAGALVNGLVPLLNRALAQ